MTNKPSHRDVLDSLWQPKNSSRRQDTRSKLNAKVKAWTKREIRITPTASAVAQERIANERKEKQLLFQNGERNYYNKGGGHLRSSFLDALENMNSSPVMAVERNGEILDLEGSDLQLDFDPWGDEIVEVDRNTSRVNSKIGLDGKSNNDGTPKTKPKVESNNNPAVTVTKRDTHAQENIKLSLSLVEAQQQDTTSKIATATASYTQQPSVVVSVSSNKKIVEKNTNKSIIIKQIDNCTEREIVEVISPSRKTIVVEYARHMIECLSDFDSVEERSLTVSDDMDEENEEEDLLATPWEHEVCQGDFKCKSSKIKSDNVIFKGENGKLAQDLAHEAKMFRFKEGDGCNKRNTKNKVKNEEEEDFDNSYDSFFEVDKSSIVRSQSTPNLSGSSPKRLKTPSLKRERGNEYVGKQQHKSKDYNRDKSTITSKGKRNKGNPNSSDKTREERSNSTNKTKHTVKGETHNLCDGKMNEEKTLHTQNKHTAKTNEDKNNVPDKNVEEQSNGQKSIKIKTRTLLKPFPLKRRNDKKQEAKLIRTKQIPGNRTTVSVRRIDMISVQSDEILISETRGPNEKNSPLTTSAIDSAENSQQPKENSESEQSHAEDKDTGCGKRQTAKPRKSLYAPKFDKPRTNNTLKVGKNIPSKIGKDNILSKPAKYVQPKIGKYNNSNSTPKLAKHIISKAEKDNASPNACKDSPKTKKIENDTPPKPVKCVSSTSEVQIDSPPKTDIMHVTVKNDKDENESPKVEEKPRVPKPRKQEFYIKEITRASLPKKTNTACIDRTKQTKSSSPSKKNKMSKKNYSSAIAKKVCAKLYNASKMLIETLCGLFVKLLGSKIFICVIFLLCWFLCLGLGWLMSWFVNKVTKIRHSNVQDDLYDWLTSCVHSVIEILSTLRIGK